MVFYVFHAGVGVSCNHRNWYTGFKTHADVSVSKAVPGEVLAGVDVDASLVVAVIIWPIIKAFLD